MDTNKIEDTAPDQPTHQSKLHKKLLIITFIVIALTGLAVLAWWLLTRTSNPESTDSAHSTSQPSVASGDTVARGLQLDPAKNYGNKYAKGILPVGDNKYVTDSPKKGYVYACSNYARNLQTDVGGANIRGPWFSSDGKTWDINKKVTVSGEKHWDGQFTNKLSDDTRTITSNDLPLDHTTGTFPIQSSDPAYAYDHNPGHISSQTFVYALSAGPTYSSTPNCVGGTVGIMLSGVQLNSAFDAGGRDAGAWETQDSCEGHPQQQGVYHYHTLSSCFKDISVHTVIGFALDGYPITGPKVGDDNFLTTSDLDECHGLTSQVTLDGESVVAYHYVMTEDFPYSVSCFRSEPIQAPGLGAQQHAQRDGQIPNREPIGDKPPLH